MRVWAEKTASTRDLLETLESRRLMSTSASSVDVALIDVSLPNFSTLSSAASKNGKVITYDGRNESAAKVLGRVLTWASANRAQIRSLSILSHGSAGRFALGNEWISTSNEHQRAWAKLRRIMGDDGNIYLFGCNVAENDGGKLLLNH